MNMSGSFCEPYFEVLPSKGHRWEKDEKSIPNTSSISSVIVSKGWSVPIWSTRFSKCIKLKQCVSQFFIYQIKGGKEPLRGYFCGCNGVNALLFRHLWFMHVVRYWYLRRVQWPLCKLWIWDNLFSTSISWYSRYILDWSHERNE